MTTAPWWEGPLVGFDLETTGPDPETARIVTACVVRESPGQRPTVATWLADPGIDIPEGATAVHGITTERARQHGESAADVVAQLLAVLKAEQDPLVAFNGAYDFTVLDREARRYGYVPLAPAAVIDPYVLDKQADTYRRGKRTLGVTCEHYGIPLGEDAHDAAADALAAVRLARAIGRREPHPPADAAVLHQGQIVWRRQQQEHLADHFRSVGKPADDVDGAWPVRPVREGVRA